MNYDGTQRVLSSFCAYGVKCLCNAFDTSIINDNSTYFEQTQKIVFILLTVSLSLWSTKDGLIIRLQLNKKTSYGLMNKRKVTLRLGVFHLKIEEKLFETDLSALNI